jgi:hypothetical protein
LAQMRGGNWHSLLASTATSLPQNLVLQENFKSK